MQKILARFKRLFRAFVQNARSAPPSGIKILLGRRFPEIVEKYALNRCRRALSHNVKHIVDFLHNIIEQTDRTRLSGRIGKGTIEVSIVFYFHKVVECVQKILARFKRLFRAFVQNARSAPPSGIKILLGRRFPEIVEKYELNRCRRALSHNVKHIVDFLHTMI